MTNIPAGWFPDPEGGQGERWWDGTKWTNQTSASSTSVPPPPPAGGWAQPLNAYTKKSNAGLSLGLSIAGIMCCGPLSIAGMIMGKSEMNAIDNGLTDPRSRGTAKAAFIVGVVAVSIWGLIVGLYVVVGVLSAASGA